MERRGIADRKMKFLRFIRNDKFGLVLRIAMGVLFVAASYYKILSPGAFAHQIYNYKILPQFMINPVALCLPWLQLICGLALIFNRGALAASILILAMLLTFQVALASALIRGLNIACGCFKAGGSPATWLTFLRDTGLVAMALLNVLKLYKDRRVN